MGEAGRAQQSSGSARPRLRSGGGRRVLHGRAHRAAACWWSSARLHGQRPRSGSRGSGVSLGGAGCKRVGDQEGGEKIKRREMRIGVLVALEGDGIERREARVSDGERLGWA